MSPLDTVFGLLAVGVFVGAVIGTACYVTVGLWLERRRR